MFPTIDRFEREVRVDSQPVKLHFRSLTFWNKFAAFILIAVAAIFIASAAALYHQPGANLVNANIILGTCCGFVALTVAYLVVKHLHFKSQVESILDLKGWENRYYFSLHSISSVPALPDLHYPGGRAKLETVTHKLQGHFTRADNGMLLLSLGDENGYHIIFEQDSSTHSQTFFPNIVKYENLEIGNRPHPLHKNVVTIQSLTNTQKKVVYPIILIAAVIFGVFLFMNAFSGGKNWDIAPLASCGSIFVLGLAYVTLKYFLFKRKVDAYLRTSDESVMKNTGNYLDASIPPSPTNVQRHAQSNESFHTIPTTKKGAYYLNFFAR